MLWCSKTNRFLHPDLRKAYEDAGTWPADDDLREVPDEKHKQFAMQCPPPGKMLGSDQDGHPAWIDSVSSEPTVIPKMQNAIEERLNDLETKLDTLLERLASVVTQQKEG